MIGQNTPDCPLGLTTDILSAWRDGGVRGDEEQRIRQHTATCAACQQRLDGFVTVARALGRQRELEPGDRVWREVRQRITAQMRGKSALLRHPAWSWRSMAAVASVILVVGLLAYVLNAVRAQRAGPAPVSTATSAITTTPTPTSSVITPGPQLAWQQAHLPPAVEVTMASLALRTLVIAPNNGDVAYLCVPPIMREGMAQETNAHIYVTRDRGQTWARGDTPVGAQPQSSGKAFTLWCSIVVDATRSDTAVVETEWRLGGEAGDTSKISTFASFDYGEQWRKLLSPHPVLEGQRMASYAGVIFASGATQSRSGGVGLWASRDQMATWQTLVLPAGLDVNAFWLNPTTGALLIAANQQGSSLLLMSVDGGARWTQLPAPSSSGTAWLVQPPQSAALWRICSATAPHGDAQANTLTCSSDGGQTWAARPALNLAQNSPKGFQFFAPASFFALTGDGAVLATVIESPIHVYRLPAGGAVWQDLGPLPGSSSPSPAYYPTPSGSVLWLSGPDVFTAAYPPA